MDDAKPSPVRRALAILVLVAVALVALRLAIGAIAAVFWLVAVAALAVAAVWAVGTLKGSGRRKKDDRLDRPAPPGQLPDAPFDDRVEAQMRQIKEQLREQGRL
jgi:hypothetical protein